MKFQLSSSEEASSAADRSTSFRFLDKREAGILLHITSLPGGHGIGDFGKKAFEFVDWMCQAGLRYWQILPLVPPGSGYSPYCSWSSMATNIDLIDLEALEAQGLLAAADLAACPENTDRVAIEKVVSFKHTLLARAYQNFCLQRNQADLAAFEQFQKQNDWVRDAALYCVLRSERKTGWADWPAADKKITPLRLAELHKLYKEKVDEQVFYQFVAESQWQRLRRYANNQGIQIIGDLPIYVDHDSVDVWLNQGQFDLDAEGVPRQVSGVPPDNFAKTGQLWGHPIYNWDVQERDGFAWWLKRLGRNLQQTDIVRIDHFRGFSAYWSVPYGSQDAVNGKWISGPGFSLFQAMLKEFGRPLPVIAEDLGLIDAPVEQLKRDAGLPGMCVLEFGFSENEDDVHHPDNHPEFSICYTGTHDNQTIVQWRSELNEVNKQKLAQKFAHEKLTDSQFAWKFIELALASRSKLCVVPLQDFQALGASARMNFPSTATGNWEWRALDGSLSMELAAEIRTRLKSAQRIDGLPN